MRTNFEFGEQVDGYGIRVLNERAVRAAAGMLFLPAIVSFMNAWLAGDFFLTRVFVIAFLADFTIRLFVSPRFAPSMIVGQWLVRKQQPEYVGAPQKRFAWMIGFVLALAMLYLVVLNNVVGPVNLLVCALCLTLLFFETAFGICLGCAMYNRFSRQAAQHCPGGACNTEAPEAARGGRAQGAILAAFVVFVAGTGMWMSGKPDGVRQSGAVKQVPRDAAEARRCEVPEFAKAMGHEEKWKLHNNCT